MTKKFQGWDEVAKRLRQHAQNERNQAESGSAAWLNAGQCATLDAIADRIVDHGLLIADEVGMGKTRVAAALVSAVVGAGGRVAILVPPVLGYQWEHELREGGAPSPKILRSLLQYVGAWGGKDSDHRPWFDESVVLLSHSFANWRLGANSAFWRWGMLPEVYARWRQRTSESGRLPRGYKKSSCDEKVRNAAISLIKAIPDDKQSPAYRIISEFVEQTPWPGALEADAYAKNKDLRPCLEKAVGLGLGLFDLVVIDEAHKSRGEDSRLSTLLDAIVLAKPEVRRFGMTATPVELDVSQWESTLARIGLDYKKLESITKDIEAYADIVRQIRQCPTDVSLQGRFPSIARQFEQALSPYVLRRDKREDEAVRRFAREVGESSADYRVLNDVSIDVEKLPHPWQQAICAAEALSLAGRGGQGADAEQLKRLRLTFGNGHGLAALLDAPLINPELDGDAIEMPAENVDRNASKREARAQWWLELMRKPFSSCNGDEALFGHPAILATVDAIEEVLERGEKVLVFGRFTRPLRRLTELLNARAMLKALERGETWPQEKVHGAPSSAADDSDWPAVSAAHAQLKCTVPLDQIDERLKDGYKNLQKERERFRADLINVLKQGFDTVASQDESWRRAKMLFEAFCEESSSEKKGEGESSALSLVGRAMEEIVSLSQRQKKDPVAFAKAFEAMMQVLSERDEGDDDGDGELDAHEASELWPTLRQRLQDDYSKVRGGMARLMYGGTSPHSRRMIQLAFNRLHSPTRVLVAQSMVGREGLNLHQACRTVVLLHPEWNPGIVEQQIGRVDRVGSYWQQCLDDALKEKTAPEALPRIEIRPVVFRGTYDEHNWQVLHERWSDLRAQLHGMVLTSETVGDVLMSQIVKKINADAPNFSPNGKGRFETAPPLSPLS